MSLRFLEQPVWLASRSPRRRELLAQVGVKFDVLAPDVDETCQQHELPRRYVERIAITKSRAGLELATACRPVLAADTSVILDDEVLGKPASNDEAEEMLGRLSGRRHTVMSAVALANDGDVAVRRCDTQVDFRPLTREEIAAYVATGEPADKAGAYAIQGLAAAFIANIEGSYSGVMGLPLYETVALLRSVST